MPTTETLQITLPTELAERIRQRVRSGEFANESECVVDHLNLDDGGLDFSEEEIEDAIRQAIPALEHLRANPSSAISHDQMVASLEAHRRLRNSQQ